MPQTIAAALALAKQQLRDVSDVAQLEAEILLVTVLNVSRSYLYTWPEQVLDESQQKDFFELVHRRSKGEPIAYLTGHREFWSLDFIVTPDVLIPRQETELLVELILNLSNEESIIADLGTGSGAIALSIAHEKPHWKVFATDASSAALEVAKLNAKQLGLTNVIFKQGEWCHALPDIKFDVIVSNPPYIAENDEHMTQGDLRFEPRSALVSAENGLRDIAQIISQAKHYLKPGGILLLEHGFQQAQNVTSIFKEEGYTDINVRQDLAGLDRVTFASWSCF